MRSCPLPLVLGLLVGVEQSAYADSESEAEPPFVRRDQPAPLESLGRELAISPRGDLFPGGGHFTIAGASGVPFLGMAEAGYAVTNGFTIGAIGGFSTSVITAGLRPRVRASLGERTALVFVMPMLWYPKASAPGPGNVGTSSWVLVRPELFLDGRIGDRWHVAGGMGAIAAASLEALGQFASGNEFAMPPYNGSKESRKGFAGGMWNTIATRASFASGSGTHIFAEAGLVMKGVAIADNVGGPPIVITIGAQHEL